MGEFRRTSLQTAASKQRGLRPRRQQRPIDGVISDPDEGGEQLKRISLVMIVATLLIGSAQVARAASPRKSDPPCTVNPSAVSVGEGYVVSVSGLPTDTPINLWITDSSGTVGYPLGGTPDGTFNLSEGSSNPGTTSYAFSGVVKHNMTVYSTCSVSVS